MNGIPTIRHLTRRRWLAALAAAGLLAPLAGHGQRPVRRLRLLLNTSYSSPQAWLWLALTRGYLAAEGIELELTPGAGAFTAAPRLAEGGYDLAYGDVNALIEVCARRPDIAPRGVYMVFNASPSCVLVAADGSIRHPRDLVGQRLIGHDSDVALRTFGALCRHQGLDPAGLSVASAWSGMAGMAEEVLAGRAAGAFGYVSTFTGALVAADPALLGQVRFLRFAEFAPDLYGSVVMASTRLLNDEPERVSRLLAAINRGAMDMLREPEAGLAALARVAPGLNPEAERARLQATLDLEMSREWPKGTRQLSVGDVDTARLARSIDLMVQGSRLPRWPDASEVFTPVFLPPAGERART